MALKETIFASGPITATVDDLLKRGYSVRVVPEARETEPWFPNGWKGRLESGELRMAEQRGVGHDAVGEVVQGRVFVGRLWLS